MDNSKEKSGIADTLKEPTVIAAIAAILVLGSSSIYFHNRLSGLEEELEKVKGHLKNVVNYIESVQKDSIKSMQTDIKVCANNVSQLSEEIKSISEHHMSISKPREGKAREPKLSYTRLTKRTSSLSPVEKEIHSTFDEDVALMEDD